MKRGQRLGGGGLGASAAGAVEADGLGAVGAAVSVSLRFARVMGWRFEDLRLLALGDWEAGGSAVMPLYRFLEMLTTGPEEEQRA